MQNKVKNVLTQIRMYRVVKRSGLFNREYYLRNNLDVARSCMNPIMHYIRHGWSEGRNPSKFFDTKWYLKTYPDVAAAGMNPLYHFILHGEQENRFSNGLFAKCSNRDYLVESVAAKQNSSFKRKCDYTPGLISIVIPIFKTEKFLDKLLNSIAHQTYNNIEVIAVDDSSPHKENVEKIVATYKKKISIRLYCLHENCGANFARNHGFSKSKGEFLFFCDADIVLSEEILEKMIQRMHSSPSVSWVYCNYFVGEQTYRFCPFDSKRLWTSNFCSTMSLIRKESFPGFDNKAKRYQDWDLFLTMNENGLVGEWIDEVLFYAADRPDGITNSNSVTDFEAKAYLRQKYGKKFNG